MSETQNIQAFNDELDRLLQERGSGGKSVDQLTPQDRAALRAAATLAGVDFSDELRPRAKMTAKMRSVEKTAGFSRPVRRPVPALRWGLAALVIALVALLVLFREPVAASLGRLFGFAYVPGAGFVSIDSVRVLSNPVTQVNEGRSLTVVRGLAAARDAQLWLEYSDGARSAEGAWLETADGQRFDLRWWGWDPNEPGTKGVRLVFPPIPADVNVMTLALPEGWRIPLEWIPAADSSLPSANLVIEQAQPSPTGEENPAQTIDTQEPAQPCAGLPGLTLCVQAAARSSEGLEVLLEAQSTGDWRPGMFQGHDLLAWAVADVKLSLSDAQGAAYLPSDAIQLFPYSEDRLGEGLVFMDAQDAGGLLSLQVPGVYGNLPLAGELVVDLGDDPQLGQEITLDQTLDVAGIPVHFSRGVVEGDSEIGERLKLYSDPVDPRDGLTPYLLVLGKPDRVDSGYGEGSENGVLTISIDLMQPAGKLTGILRLPLVGATLLVNGPFTLTFDAPQATTMETQTPQVIEDGEFTPLPTGEALPMQAYSYSGRVLQPGDLLAVNVGSDRSTLFASTQGGPADEVAVLPGQVLAVYAHVDLGGIDYVTGALDPEHGDRYEQLYTLRFDQSSPRLLVGAFKRMAYGFSWSFDGRWLAYLAARSEPGESGARAVHLVDLTCRETGACQEQTAPSPDNLDLHDLAWSPVEERLLALGVPQNQASGASDVFTIYIDPQDGKVYLTNLTESSQIDDQGAQWLGDGTSLLITCSTPEIPLNFYGLCSNDLQRGMDNLVIEQLPFNMRLALNTPEGRILVDRTPVYEDGVLRLRAYDRSSAESRSLIEWPAAKGGFIEPSISADGVNLAVVEPGMLSLLSIRLEDGSIQPILQAQSPLTWVGWVR